MIYNDLPGHFSQIIKCILVSNKKNDRNIFHSSFVYKFDPSVANGHSHLKIV